MTSAGSRTERKHEAILAAAEQVFLAEGYSGASMDEITTRAGVSKQTVYAHFGTKEALFVDVVRAMTGAVSASVHDVERAAPAPGQVAAWLEDYAVRQLRGVLAAPILQLRRLVIGEVERFPDLARALWDEGPQRAMANLTRCMEQLTADGHLNTPDPARAAEQLNWLVMGQPLNQAMLLGSQAVLSRAKIKTHARAAVQTFLAAHAAS